MKANYTCMSCAFCDECNQDLYRGSRCDAYIYMDEYIAMNVSDKMYCYAQFMAKQDELID